MAPSFTISCVAAAISAFTSSPEKSSRVSQFRRRPCAAAKLSEPFELQAVCAMRLLAIAAVGRRIGRAALAVGGPAEHRSYLSHRYRWHCRALRSYGHRSSPALVAAALLQFLLHRALLHPEHQPTRATSSLLSSSRSVAIIVSNVAARARSLAVAAMGRARTTESLYAFSRKLVGRRHARRCALGNRLSNCVDVAGSASFSCSRSTAPSRSRPAIRPRMCLGRGRSRRREMGLGDTTGRPGAAPIRFPARSGCSCRCAPGAAPSASSASTVTSRDRC